MPESLYEIQYSQSAVEDVESLRAYDQRKIITAIERHLLHRPTQTSRVRIKRMIQPFWSQFRLRVDDFRVYYDVGEESRLVSVLRVLKKSKERTPETDDEAN